MTRTQHQWIRANMGDENDYVAHIEDALMSACLRIADGSQEYSEANSPIGWFRHFMLNSKVNPNSGESPLLLGNYEDNLFLKEEK